MEKCLTLQNIEELDYLVEEMLHTLRFSGLMYDENGRFRGTTVNDEDIKYYWEHAQDNILEFSTNEVIKSLTLKEVRNLSLDEIKMKYLQEVLPKARNMMRNQAPDMFNWTISSEISDEYLENLFAIHWRWNAMIWIVQRKKQKEPEKGREE